MNDPTFWDQVLTGQLWRDVFPYFHTYSKGFGRDCSVLIIIVLQLAGWAARLYSHRCREKFLRSDSLAFQFLDGETAAPKQCFRSAIKCSLNVTVATVAAAPPQPQLKDVACMPFQCDKIAFSRYQSLVWETPLKPRTKFGIGIGIIVLSLSALAWMGAKESQTYYHTISELPTLTAAARHQRIRVGGDVAAGSIHHLDGRVDFALSAEGKTLPVSYVGADPLPDTFKDGAQCLVEGHTMPDGRFVAETIQAKCASKYEAAPGGDTAGTPPPASGVDHKR